MLGRRRPISGALHDLTPPAFPLGAGVTLDQGAIIVICIMETSGSTILIPMPGRRRPILGGQYELALPVSPSEPRDISGRDIMTR